MRASFTLLSLGIGCVLILWVAAKGAEPAAAPPPVGVSADLVRTIEGFRLVSNRISCSGEPLGDEAFRKLAQAGIRTIISVDGKTPDVRLATQNGLRYIHLPIGYDGVPINVQAALREALRTTEGPVLIHCHHGKHRGPAAAAIAAMLGGEITREGALALLAQAGTGADYQGLWRDVRTFQPPPPGAQAAPLVPAAEVSPLVREMIRMDTAMEEIEALAPPQKPGGALPPPLQPTAAANLQELSVVLEEAYRESARHGRGNYPDAMVDQFAAAMPKIAELQSVAKSRSVPAIHAQLAALKADCRACHRDHRN